MNERRLPLSALEEYPPVDRAWAQGRLRAALDRLDRKIVVLDDDPTGVQTVYGVCVYTDWRFETLLEAFRAKEKMFFILTNSRGFSRERTASEHAAMARAIARAARETGWDFVLISRSDSTLRGHYPLETQVLRDVLEEETGQRYDGEILVPFFKEGGRYTIGDVHYVAMDGMLTPAGQTEFAQDRTFGYRASNLREYVEEKCGGAVRAGDVASVPLELLRRGDAEGVARILAPVHDFGKVVVNAIDYADIEVFALGFIQAVNAGKRFLFRSAAAITKVLGGVGDRPLLSGGELTDPGNQNGGLIVVGSHVQKTTLQLERLKRADCIDFIEFDVRTVTNEAAFTAERARVLHQEEKSLREGRTAAVYTSRARLDANTGNAEDDLRLSLRISDAVTGFVRDLTLRPRFILAKGGITSSEIGTRGLKVKKAHVMGQILPGIPVWQTGGESKFPGLPYVIFPGNVGSEDALYEAVMKLDGRGEKLQ